MGEYGPGISFGQACMMDKERIIHAFNGELMIGEDMDKDGVSHFVYEHADKKDCLAYILAAYDNAVYQAKEAAASGRALERLFEEVTGIKTANHFKRYMALSEEERKKFPDYHYESDTPVFHVIRGGAK